jgi:hypothetical protein
MAYREDHPVTLSQGDDFGTRLHAWALFGHYEFTAGKIHSWD